MIKSQLQLIRTFSYFCGMENLGKKKKTTRIKSDNFLPGEIRTLEVLYNF